MIKQPLLVSTVVATLLLTSVSVFADDKTQVYGSQLMTEQERIEHRTDMQNAQTKTERSQVRNEHHKRMKERAKKQGLSLPDEVPSRGGGMRSTKGMGKGMGIGGGRNR